MAECYTCHTALQGSWNMTSGFTNARTGRHLGITNGYFLYPEGPNWIYSYCEACWKRAILSLPFVPRTSQALEEQRSTLTQQLATSTQEKSSLETQLNTLRQEKSSVEKQLETTQQQKFSLDQQLQASRAETISLGKQLEALKQVKASLDQQLLTLTNEKTSLERQLDNSRQENASLKEQLDASQMIDAKLKAILSEMKIESATLKQKTNELNDRCSYVLYIAGIEKLREVFRQLKPTQIDALKMQTNFHVDQLDERYRQQQLHCSEQFTKSFVRDLKSNLKTIIAEQNKVLKERQDTKESVIKLIKNPDTPQEVLDNMISPYQAHIDQAVKSIDEWNTFFAILTSTFEERETDSEICQK